MYKFYKNSQETNKIRINLFKDLVKNPSSDIRFFNTLIIPEEENVMEQEVNVGDGVLISKTSNSFYIARVDAFYAIGDKAEKHAVVTWFYQQEEIPKHKRPSHCSNKEIFLCTANIENTIDAETIVDKCIIHFTEPNVNQEKTYFCTKSFDGKKIQVIVNDSVEKKIKSKINANKPNPKIIVSEKTLVSTLSLEKNFKTSLPTSPVSASSLGRLNASEVALGLFDHSVDVCRSVDNEKKSKKSTHSRIKISNKDLFSTLKSPNPSVKNTTPLTEINALNVTTSNPTQQGMVSKLTSTDVKVTVKRLKEEELPTNENNLPCANVRRSSRITLKPETKNLHLSEKTNSTPLNEGDSDYFDESISGEDDSLDLSEDSDFEISLPRRQKRYKTTIESNQNKEATPVKARKNSKSNKTFIKKKPEKRRAFIPERKIPLKLASTDFDEARERLHVSAVPDSLPCREDEFQAIYTFIEGKINSGTGGCMYVSGVPGTGKTATVMEVLSSLRDSVADGLLEEFNYIDINGMRLTEPRQAYVSILKQLKDVHATSDHAANLLTKYFSMRGKKPTLLVVDELDLLWTKKQDVLYHIFDWPSHRHARLIVIAIANTMDLPERIMLTKVSSRLGLTRLSFLPYTYKQLQEIITSRLKGLAIFQNDAIQLVARKVAAVSGDARRCLDVCRRAIEIADKKTNKELKAASIENVHEALQEMFASPMISMMRNCTEHEKIVLRSIVAEFRRSGLEEATLTRILNHHNKLSQVDGLPPSSVSSIIKVCNHLACSRLILLESTALDLYARIRLNVSVDDVLFALNKD